MAELFSNPVLIAIISASTGIIVSGIINFFLQRRQDSRRFENEQAIQEQRWEREDEIQRQRWEREDRLRNYEERRQMYTELMRATDPIQADRVQQRVQAGDAAKCQETTDRLEGELRILAPAAVWVRGDRLIRSFLRYLNAAYSSKLEEIDAEHAELLEKRHLFMRLAQKDLGIEREEDKEILNFEYREIQNRKKSLGDR